MARFIENYGRTLDPKSHSRTITIEDCPDELTAFNLVNARTPANYGSLVNKEIKVKEIGYRMWEADVSYAPIDKGKDDDPKPEDHPQDDASEDLEMLTSFDTTGTTTRITQCLDQLDFGVVGRPDIKQARVVGLTRDGVEGVEIVVPKLEFTHTIRQIVVPAFWFRDVTDRIGKVNRDPFAGHAAGEVLFLGAVGSRATAPDPPDDIGPHWRIDFKYAVSRNAVNIRVGDIVVPSKKGWQYMWVLYQREEQDGLLVPKPETAFVADIYEEASFRDLYLLDADA